MKTILRNTFIACFIFSAVFLFSLVSLEKKSLLSEKASVNLCQIDPTNREIDIY